MAVLTFKLVHGKEYRATFHGHKIFRGFWNEETNRLERNKSFLDFKLIEGISEVK